MTQLIERIRRANDELTLRYFYYSQLGYSLINNFFLSARFRSRAQKFRAIFSFQKCWTSEHSINIGKALHVSMCPTLNMIFIMFPTFNMTLGSEAVSVPVPPILAA